MNVVYRGPDDLPDTIPVFPLGGALLLPRGQLPLNIFEPRYLAMVDHALATQRIIGLLQPEGEPAEEDPRPRLYKVGCVGRLVRFAESGDGRYLVSLAGIARYQVRAEIDASTPFRQCHVDYRPYLVDFHPRHGEDEVDRERVLTALRRFVESTKLKIDWKSIDEAPNEALVNALSMMAPVGVREKQALLEAPDLKARAETLIAVTEMELAKSQAGPQNTLQ